MENMDPLIVGSLIAVTGWLVTHFSKLHFAKRTARLERVNAQLGKLYGPLMATLTASHKTWTSFTEKHFPSHGMKGYFGKGQNSLSQEELERWRIWLKYVFHPLNERVEKLIIENTHLINEKEIPVSFTKALAHVSAYRAIIAQWDSGDFTEHVSVNNWPTRELMESVKPVFEKLSIEQAKLL